MKVIFMGTPDFACPALEALYKEGCEIALVLTKPDRPRDRGKKFKPSPVKESALKLGLPVETPEKIRGNTELIEKLRAVKPDIIISAAYGQILPKEVLDIPRLGCVNIHGSLLPEYRGAAPVQRAVSDGKAETGVTLMYMAEGLDTGDIIAKTAVPIGNKTSGQLLSELSLKGAELLIKTLPSIENGTAPGIPQDDSLASYAPMIKKEEGHMDWRLGAEKLCRTVRAFGDEISVYSSLGEKKMKVLLAEASEEESGAAPGTVVKTGSGGICVAAGKGTVILKKIQLPGKKAMDAAAFLLGNKIDIGTVLR